MSKRLDVSASQETGSVEIECLNLTKRYRGVAAVSDLTWRARPGRVTGFLGANGAGKTTTLKVLLGLAQPDDGYASFSGQRYGDMSCPQRVVGAVLEPRQHPRRSGRDHLRVGAVTARVSNARVDEVLEMVELAPAARRLVGTYSLGMRQRLAVAHALLGNPACLVLDEPTNGLDPPGRAWLQGLLRTFAAAGGTVLMSSHVLAEIQATADDVVMIAGGRLIKEATIGDFVGTMGVKVRVRQLERAAGVFRRCGLSFHQAADEEGSYFVVDTTDPTPLGESLHVAGVPVHELTRQHQGLEAEFLSLLKESS